MSSWPKHSIEPSTLSTFWTINHFFLISIHSQSYFPWNEKYPLTMSCLLRNCYLKNKTFILQGEDSMSIIACLNGLIALVGSERTLIPVSDSTN